MKVISQKGFIKYSLLISGVFLTFATVGAGYLAIKYSETSKFINEAKQLSSQENYSEAISKLGLAQISNPLGIKTQEINKELENNGKLSEDKIKYDKGVENIDKGDLQGAIDLLSELPENSFYYQKAQTKIEEAKRKIVEGDLAGEKTARGEAEEKALQEEQVRKVAEGKVTEETSKRIIEETARKNAEQEANSERLAKEEEQRKLEISNQQTKQEEKAKFLELARTNPLVEAIIKGELKFYIEPVPLYAGAGVSAAVDDVVINSFLSWNPYGAPIKRVYSSNDADLTVSWVRDYGSGTLGQAIYRAHIKVGLGSNNCKGSWSAFDANTVKKILWHELGHSMGYGHSSNPNNIMYYQMDTRFEVDQQVSEVIPGSYYQTIPLCGAGEYSYSFETEDSSTGFDIFVLPSSQDASEISGGSGSYYIDCGAKNMHSFSGSCTVESGSKIYIGNISRMDAIQLSGKIIDMETVSWPDMTWDQNVFQYDSNELTKIWDLFH